MKMTRGEPIDRTKNRLKILFKKAGLDEIISPSEFVANGAKLFVAVQLAHAEQLGLGFRKYHLIE